MHYDEESIHLTEFVLMDLAEIENQEQILADMEKLLAVRKDVLKALEEARNAGLIKKSLEASVKLHLDDDTKALVEKYLSNPAQWLIVSKAELTDDELPAYEVSQVSVEKAKGHVCPRCWNYTEEGEEGDLCPRCKAVLGQE